MYQAAGTSSRLCLRRTLVHYRFTERGLPGNLLSGIKSYISILSVTSVFPCHAGYRIFTSDPNTPKPIRVAKPYKRVVLLCHPNILLQKATVSNLSIPLKGGIFLFSPCRLANQRNMPIPKVVVINTTNSNATAHCTSTNVCVYEPLGV